MAEAVWLTMYKLNLYCTLRTTHLYWESYNLNHDLQCANADSVWRIHSFGHTMPATILNSAEFQRNRVGKVSSKF